MRTIDNYFNCVILSQVRCTQPFNKHVQYGVSFITLHSVPKKKEKNSEFDISWSSKKVPSPKKAATSFGKFKIARSGSESSDDNISSFQKWRNFKKSNETSSSAKTIEPTLKEKIESLKKAEKRRQSFKNDDEEDSSNQKLDRNRNSLLYDMDDDLPNEKLEKKIRLDKSHSSTSTNKAETTSKSNSKKTDITDEATKRKFDFLFDNNPPDRSSSNSTSKSKSSEHRSSKESPKKGDHHSRRDSPKKSERSDKSSSSSRHSRSDDSKSIKSSPSKSSNHNRDADKKTPSKHDKRSNSSKHAVTYQPFKKLLSGVVFVISGIQNPDRNDLRKKALELGGKYKSDWDSSCTHLICAFKNTPKYVQVLGEGKIVDKRWIEKCYKEKKRLIET